MSQIKSVYDILCLQCQNTLSSRGQNIRLVSNHSVTGFSSDVPSAQVQESKDISKFETCQCLVRKLFCKICCQSCGHHVVNACQNCLSAENNRMYWIFINVKGLPTGQNWSELKQPAIDFQKFLVSHGFEDTTIQILVAEKITSLEDISLLSNQDLKSVGLKLGEIAKLRNFQ